MQLAVHRARGPLAESRDDRAHARNDPGRRRRARAARVAAHDPLAVVPRARRGQRGRRARDPAPRDGRDRDDRSQHARHGRSGPDPPRARGVSEHRDRRDHGLRHGRERRRVGADRHLRLPREAVRRGEGGRGDRARGVAPARARRPALVPRGARRRGRARPGRRGDPARGGAEPEAARPARRAARGARRRGRGARGGRAAAHDRLPRGARGDDRDQGRVHARPRAARVVLRRAARRARGTVRQGAGAGADRRVPARPRQGRRSERAPACARARSIRTSARSWSSTR